MRKVNAKVKFHEKGVSIEDAYAKWFLLHCHEIGMSSDDLGKTIPYDNKLLPIKGLNENKTVIVCGSYYVPVAYVKDRLAGIPIPVPEKTEREKNYEKFQATYEDQTTTTTPFRCCDETTGYYVRKDGQPCTDQDIEFVTKTRNLGQKTVFTLENGKIKVYGFCDHGD